jgi:hypothetical protein
MSEAEAGVRLFSWTEHSHNLAETAPSETNGLPPYTFGNTRIEQSNIAAIGYDYLIIYDKCLTRPAF